MEIAEVVILLIFGLMLVMALSVTIWAIQQRAFSRWKWLMATTLGWSAGWAVLCAVYFEINDDIFGFELDWFAVIPILAGFVVGLGVSRI